MGRVVQVGEEAFGSTDFEPIPAGTKLQVSVFDIEETTVQNGENVGKPQFVWTAKVTEEGEYKGREIRYNYVPLFAGAKNEWVLVSFAEAVGWKTSKESGVEVPDNLRDVLGTELVAKFGVTTSQKINPDTGKPYLNNRVNGTAKIKEGKGTPKAEKKGWGDL